MRERWDRGGEVYIGAREREGRKKRGTQGRARGKAKVIRGEAVRCTSGQVQAGREWKRAEWGEGPG